MRGPITIYNNRQFGLTIPRTTTWKCKFQWFRANIGSILVGDTLLPRAIGILHIVGIRYINQSCGKRYRGGTVSLSWQPIYLHRKYNSNINDCTTYQSTIRRILVVTLLLGHQRYLPSGVIFSTPTVLSEHLLNCGHKPPTWFGQTTAVAQAWPTSTSPWLMNCQPCPTHRTRWC